MVYHGTVLCMGDPGVSLCAYISFSFREDEIGWSKAHPKGLSFNLTLFLIPFLQVQPCSKVLVVKMNMGQETKLSQERSEALIF